MKSTSQRTKTQRGATLLVFALILLLATTYTLISSFSSTRISYQKQEVTSSALAQARDALIGYAATYRDVSPNEVFGYLPCPNLTGDGSAPASCLNADEVSIGLLPYKKLGLPALRDGNGDCLWYAVSGSHKNSPKSTALFPLGTMNADTSGHLRIVDLAGSILATPSDANGGVVAVIFSPGPPRPGAANRVPLNTECSADPALLNAYLDGGYAATNTATVLTPVTITSGKSNDTVNNDLLAWITPQDIFFRSVRLRVDYQSQLNSLLSNLQATLQSATLPAPLLIPGVTIPTDKNVGHLPAGIYNDTSFPLGYFNQYRDQILYSVCNPATRCFVVNGASCTGVMIYAGDRATGQSRTTTNDRNNPANYLEAGNLSSFITSGLKSFSGNSDYLVPATNVQLPASTDVVRCLNPPGAVSFTADIAQLTSTAPTLPNGGNTVAINIADQNLTLGAIGVPDVSAAANSLLGCSWFKDNRPFLSGIRAYMEVQLIQTGDGFTLSIVDGDNNPSLTMCGAAGQHLGYSGEPPIISGSSLTAIQPPKIALEFDFIANTGFDESLGDLSSGREDDDTLTPHAAFVLWGNSSVTPSVSKPAWDDNVHGFGVSPTKNPALTNNNSLPFAVNGGNLVVRVEIDRDPVLLNYKLRAWIYDATNSALSASGGLLLSNLRNTALPMGSSPSPTLSHSSIKIDSNSAEPFRNIRFGFTNGQSTTDQQIVIRNFEIRNIP
ncbi:MAG: hypothetical protein WCL27_01890 [Betaproteobacteria bacterium]